MDGSRPEDLDSLARDWITLWQSELAALATDREAQETWIRLLALWAGFASAGLRAAPRSAAEDEPFLAGAPEATGPAPARAAPDARGTEANGPAGSPAEPLLAAILERLDAIERRLAALESAPRRDPTPGRPAPRRPRKPAAAERPRPD